MKEEVTGMELSATDNLLLENLLLNEMNGNPHVVYPNEYLAIARPLDEAGYLFWQPARVSLTVRIWLTEMGREYIKKYRSQKKLCS